MGEYLMKSHRSLRTERTAVRQNANTGEGSWESHGFLGNFRNFSCNCLRGLITFSRPRPEKFLAGAVHPCDFPQVHALHAFAANVMLGAAVRLRSCPGEQIFTPAKLPPGGLPKRSTDVETRQPGLHLQLPGPGLGLRKGNLSKSMEIQFYGPKTDTAGEYISTNQQPVTIATIIHIIVRLFFTRERKLL